MKKVISDPPVRLDSGAHEGGCVVSSRHLDPVGRGGRRPAQDQVRELAQLPVRVGGAQAFFDVEERGQFRGVSRRRGVEFLRVDGGSARPDGHHRTCCQQRRRGVPGPERSPDDITRHHPQGRRRLRDHYSYFSNIRAILPGRYGPKYRKQVR